MNKKVQAQEMTLNRSIFVFALLIPFVVVLYLFFVYSSTATAYSIEQTEQEEISFSNDIAELETILHLQKREITLNNTGGKKLVAISNEVYVDTDTQYYSLAGGLANAN